MALVLQVQDANDPVHLVGDLFLAVTFQLDAETRSRSSRQTELTPLPAFCVRRTCEHLCEEEQVLPDGEVVEQDVVLRTEAQAAADQSHVLADVVAVDVGPAAGGRKQPCEDKQVESSQSDNRLRCVLILARRSPVSMDSVVVFPAPLCPSSTVICPSNMFTVRFCTASRILLPTLNS